MTTRNWRNQASRIFGKFASAEFPLPLQTMINTFYVRLMKVDLTEFAEVSVYPSLNALFTRQFITERPFDHSPNTFISPTDSRITHPYHHSWSRRQIRRSDCGRETYVSLFHHVWRWCKKASRDAPHWVFPNFFSFFSWQHILFFLALRRSFQ